MKFNVKTVCVMVLTALMTLISCGGNDHEPNGKTTPKPDVKPTGTVTKYVGGDISLLPEYEKARAIFKDKGTAVAPLVLFKKVGWNAMRLRLFVNPDQYKGADRDPNACQNLAYILPLAKQIKAAGFKLLLDFHYSDTWADPAKQWTPAAWAGLDDSQLAAKLKAYTAEVLTKMKQNGTEPDLIQTGNEISYGMLWGQNAATARYCYPSSPQENWNRFTQLLHAATAACREICPKAKIILHTERVSTSQQHDNANYQVLMNFYQQMQLAKIDYDVIGLSYYPYFHGSMNELNDAISRLERAFANKNIMLVETGYPYKWAVGGSTFDYTAQYPYSLQGQQRFTAALITMLKTHKRVTGLFWWWPEYNAFNTQLSGWYNAPLFDSTTGEATPALYELKKFAE